MANIFLNAEVKRKCMEVQKKMLKKIAVDSSREQV